MGMTSEVSIPLSKHIVTSHPSCLCRAYSRQAMFIALKDTVPYRKARLLKIHQEQYEETLEKVKQPGARVGRGGEAGGRGSAGSTAPV